MIPNEITREHLLAAIETIDREGYDDRFESTRFDVTHRGRKYPPKQVVRIAAQLATGQKIDFSGGVETNSFLEQHGFEIVAKGTFSARAFLLIWNPKKWKWIDRADAIAQVETSGMFFDRWSVGNRTDLPPGSRIYLMRLGKHPKGLVGSGWSTSAPERTVHWAGSKAAAGRKALYVGVEFDVLAQEPILSAEELSKPPFDRFQSWLPQSSGLELPSEIAQALDKSWAQRTPSHSVFKLAQSNLYPEGAKRQASVVVYERDPRARIACIEHYGLNCFICGFDFREVYGEAFDRCIHVHHLQQVSDMGGTYFVDPIEDLRPVCPNCHAALHYRRSKPYTVDELKQFIAERGTIN